RRTNGGCELQVLTNRQVLVKRVLLRDVTDVTLQTIEIRVKRLAVQKNLPAGRLQLSRQNFQQSALTRATRTHDTDELAARDRKRNSLEADVAATEPVRHFTGLQAANNVALFLDDPF